MAYYDYDFLRTQKIGFGWVDTSDKIRNPLALGLARNITEYWTWELENYGIPFTCMDSADDILHWFADCDYKYAIVASIGNNLSYDREFPKELARFISEIDYDDFTIAGHILDKQDKFYELHHQMFLVNLNWWNDAGRPVIGSEHCLSKMMCNVTRSEENHHDEYTPLWIEAGVGVREYNGTRYGHNIINEALKSGKRIYSFDKGFRLSKYYFYPEVNSDWHNKLDYVQRKLNTSSIHYVANTENPPTIIWDNIKVNKCDGAVSTAGGLSPLLTAYTSRLEPGDKLMIADISFSSLNIQRHIIERHIDLSELNRDIHGILHELYGDDLGLTRNRLYGYNNLARMEELMKSMFDDGLLDYYENVFPKLQIAYRYVNYYDPNHAGDMINGYFKECNDVYINLSNVFHYQNTGWLYSEEQRYDFEKTFTNKLYEAGDKYILKNIRHRNASWNGIRISTIMNNQERFLNTPEYIKEFPWTRR